MKTGKTKIRCNKLVCAGSVLSSGFQQLTKAVRPTPGGFFMSFSRAARAFQCLQGGYQGSSPVGVFESFPPMVGCDPGLGISFSYSDGIMSELPESTLYPSTGNAVFLNAASGEWGGPRAGQGSLPTVGIPLTESANRLSDALYRTRFFLESSVHLVESPLN
jgi:hypothetical protein